MRSSVSAWLPLLVTAFLGAPAGAADTQWWSTDSPADYVKAESHGVVVRADGSLEPGPGAVAYADDSLRVAWAVAVLADGSVAIAGDRGRIDRWSAKDGVRPWVRLGSGQVLSLARDGHDLLAGTGPHGLIYRISARGDTTLVARTGERYVWAVAPAGVNAIWAATGTRGRLLRIERGVPRPVFDSDESNLVCMVSDDAGGVYAGGDSKGRIYHVSSAGVATTVFDAGEDEVRALARTADGAVWAAALAVSAVTDEAPAEEDKPQPVHGPVAGGRATVYRIVPDSSTVAWWTSPQPLLYALAASREGVIAGSGNRAGVFRIERVNGAAQLLAPPQGQVTALATAADGGLWAATTNPVVLWKLGPGRSERGELISAPFDAHRFTRFGHLRWNGRGQVHFSTRSGNTDPADTTWSDWAALRSGEGAGSVASPGARYLEWKAELASADARVNDVSVAWREPNLAPRVDDLSLAEQARGVRDGEISARSEAVTQTLPGGQKVEYSISLPNNKAIRELPVWARGLRTLQWRGSDPNGDALRYQVDVQRENSGEWVNIGKDFEATMFTWNTNTLPDGRYRLRVIANDSKANAIGEERTGEALSEPFTVDNTPPVVAELAAEGAHVHGTAEDAMSPLARLDLAVDDGEWRTIAPQGGFTDTPRAAFAVTVPGLAAGEHLVSVRAIDLAGNSAVRAVSLRIDKAR